MARMSAEKRIELGNEMIQRYENAGFPNQRSVLFVRDMICRLKSGRGMTARQRAWFDSEIFSEPPELQNKGIVMSIRAAAQMPEMGDVVEPLAQFADKLSAGRSLSEKQQAWLVTLLEKAENIRKNGPWKPNSDEIKQIEIGWAFMHRYGSYYWQANPGLTELVHRVTNWKRGGAPFIREYDARMMMKICKGDRDRMQKFSIRFPAGSMVEFKHLKALGMVVDDEPHVGADGYPQINIFINGAVKPIQISELKKPSKKVTVKM